MLFEMISLFKIVNVYQFTAAAAASDAAAVAAAAVTVLGSLGCFGVGAVFLLAVVMSSHLTAHRSKCKDEQKAQQRNRHNSTVYNLQFVHNRPTVDSALSHLPCFHNSLGRKMNTLISIHCVSHVCGIYWFLCNIFLSLSISF